MTDLLSRKEGAVLFYRVECFQILADWLALAGQSPAREKKELLEKALKVSSHLYDFLIENRFENVWEKLQRNFRASRNLLKGFHDWFDGLKTMKLIHHLSAGPYPREEPERIVSGLLRWAGLEAVEGLDSQLEMLRSLQIKAD
jgi:hypothetical protein